MNIMGMFKIPRHIRLSWLLQTIYTDTKTNLMDTLVT